MQHNKDRYVTPLYPEVFNRAFQEKVKSLLLKNFNKWIIPATFGIKNFFRDMLSKNISGNIIFKECERILTYDKRMSVNF